MVLALRFWREGALVLALLGLWGLWGARDRALVERGKALERYAVADSALRATAKQTARTDTLIVHDTKTVRQTIARVDTLRDTVLAHLTDTLVVKEFVTRADSALKACTELANDCATFRTLANQRFAAYEAKLAAQPAMVVRSCTGKAMVTLVIGGVVGVGLARAIP